MPSTPPARAHVPYAPQPSPIALPAGLAEPAAPNQPAPPQPAPAVPQAPATGGWDAARARDVLSAFAGLPRVRPAWTHRYLKLLLAGQDGLGKTTFVRNLFAPYAADAGFPVADASRPNAAEIFGRHPEELCTEVVVKDEAQCVWWHFFVQDTPGCGDSDDPASERAAVLDYVASCSRAFLDAERDPSRPGSISDLQDVRVDAVLYFFPPHRLRKGDLCFARALAGAAPLVPVLAKADAMTAEELQEYRSEVSRALGRTASMWSFSPAALEEAGARRGPPFAVVASPKVDPSVGRFWPVRAYPWGVCEPLLSAHSDLPALRRLLLESGYHELKAATEERYGRYRSEALDKNPLPKPVRGLLRLAAGAAAAYLFVMAVEHGPPLVRDRAKRAETVRRVKNKVADVVGDVVEATAEGVGSAVEAAQDVAAIAAAATGVVKAAADGAAAHAARAVEGEGARRACEEREAGEERAVYAARPWWHFWGE